MTLENLMSHIKDKNCIQTKNGEIVIVYSYPYEVSKMEVKINERT